LKGSPPLLVSLGGWGLALVSLVKVLTKEEGLLSGRGDFLFQKRRKVESSSLRSGLKGGGDVTIFLPGRKVHLYPIEGKGEKGKSDFLLALQDWAHGKEGKSVPLFRRRIRARSSSDTEKKKKKRKGGRRR